MKNKGWLIGGVIGSLIFLYFNNFCIRYAIRENIILSSFFTCFGIAGSNCCAITLGSIFFNFVIWMVVPAIIGVVIGGIILRFKK